MTEAAGALQHCSPALPAVPSSVQVGPQQPQAESQPALSTSGQQCSAGTPSSQTGPEDLTSNSGKGAPGGPLCDDKPPVNKHIQRLKLVWDFLLEQWFVIGLLVGIGIAAALPNFGRTGGWIRAEYTIKYGAVVVIFLLSGLSLKTRVLVNAMARLHVHIFFQFICLVLTPAVGYGIYKGLLNSSIDISLVRGVVIAMAMPTTISTNVVFTKQAAGNEALALINAVVGNVIGIFVSPGWLALYLGEAAGTAPFSEVFTQLGTTVIAPLVAGQIIQYYFEKYVKWLQERVNFGKVSNCMIILLVWSTFCNTFHSKVSVGAGDVVAIFFLDLALFIAFVLLNFGLGTAVPLKHALQLDKPDAVAVVMCCSTKTLALGAPLVVVLYGKNANVGLMVLPLLMFHLIQCLSGAFLIKPFKRWVEGPSPGAWPARYWRKASPDPGSAPVPKPSPPDQQQASTPDAPTLEVVVDATESDGGRDANATTAAATLTTTDVETSAVAPQGSRTQQQ